jgi:urease beta subunit
MTVDELPPGAILAASGSVDVNAGLPVTWVRITNVGDVPVHLTAHFHVFEANPRLRFDRRKAFGMRPDVPSGGAVRIEPGQTVDVPLVPIGGRRVVHGFHGFVDGALDQVEVDALLERMVVRGFLHQPEDAPG